MTIDEKTAIHSGAGIAATIAISEILQKYVVKDPSKATVYATGIVMAVGLIKEANDAFQLIPLRGEADPVDVAANMAGVIAGMYVRNSLYIQAKYRQATASIMNMFQGLLKV